MPSKTGNQPKNALAPDAKSSAKRGELEAGELDKVVGGMKPVGAAGPKKTFTKNADPCEGGE